ncbi:META domain-containing protein [Nitrososphaera viennensis]|uniref:META domain-containing protein n=1 Tax=Nitrososphaera viennensis TaxID=1034015 RepID=UPI001D127E2B|nr:META domain-containing protein [Nitrososphaera viennensis]
MLAAFLALDTKGNVTSEELSAYAWQMRSFSPDGRDKVDVSSHRFFLSINATQIGGKICNGFVGNVQYVNPSTIKGQQVFFTDMGCGGQGSLIMSIEKALQDGLGNGMAMSENGNTLTLRDMVTNATFTYGKPQ